REARSRRRRGQPPTRRRARWRRGGGTSPRGWENNGGLPRGQSAPPRGALAQRRPAAVRTERSARAASRRAHAGPIGPRMSGGVLLATAAGLVGVHAACFHGWVSLQHRPAREHRWVALIGAPVALVCFGTPVLADPPSTEAALTAVRLQIAGGMGITLGLLRFGARRFGVDAPVLLRAADVFCAGVVAIVVLAPGWLLELERGVRPVPGLVAPMAQFEYTPLAAVLIVPTLALLVTSVGFAVRGVRRGQAGARPLVAALAAWVAFAALDSATAFGLTGLPLLLAAGGYPVLVLSLSAVLMRDAVLAIDQSGRLG